MSKLLVSIWMVFGLVMPLFAQKGNGVVIGLLREKGTGQPVEMATIALRTSESQQVVTGGLTDSKGYFRVDQLPQGSYYVEASFVGYRPVRSEAFTLASNQTVDVGTLYIIEGEQLNEVVVEGRKSTFVAQLDRKVFHVGQDILSSSGSASDLMQNIPSVEVDMEGTVSLRGNENVTILINGKPSAMMSAKTRGDALNQLSASSIERIEIITNPSAEYKPDGVSGIINIVMKKEAGTGLNGVLNGNIGSYGRNNAGVNLNYGMKGVNLFGGYTYRRDRYDRTMDDQRTSSNAFIHQTTYGLGQPVSHTIRLGMNANLTDRDALEVAGSYNRRRFQRNEQVESTTNDLEGQLMDLYQRNRDACAKENMWEGTFRYTHDYGQGNSWGIDYTYSSETEDEINRYITHRLSDSTKDNEGVWDANYLHVGKLYGLHQFSEQTKFSFGYELEHLRAEQNYHLSDWDGTQFVPNQERSSDFTHLRMLHSLYATLEMSLDRWSLLVGMRGEYAYIENQLISADTIAKQHYVNIYPTLHLSRQLNAHHELQFNYSLRVNRPEGDDMNPFAERINPLSLQAGNPDLKPEKIHSLEAGWLWHTEDGLSLMSTLYYRYLTNQITKVSRYIDEGVLLTTKENLDHSQSAGVELIWNYPVAKRLSFNWNLNGFYNQIDATRLGYSQKKSTFSWSTLLNANFTPLPHSLIQLNAHYRGSALMPQGKMKSSCRINLGMKYDIPSLNLSVLASVSDLFDTYRQSYTLDTPELKQQAERRKNPRIIYFGLSWQFGSGKGKKQSAKVEYDEGM